VRLLDADVLDNTGELDDRDRPGHTHHASRRP
jgi:hypothetical protein